MDYAILYVHKYKHILVDIYIYVSIYKLLQIDVLQLLLKEFIIYGGYSKIEQMHLHCFEQYYLVNLDY